MSPVPGLPRPSILLSPSSSSTNRMPAETCPPLHQQYCLSFASLFLGTTGFQVDSSLANIIRCQSRNIQKPVENLECASFPENFPMFSSSFPMFPQYILWISSAMSRFFLWCQSKLDITSKHFCLHFPIPNGEAAFLAQAGGDLHVYRISASMRT